MTEHPRRSRRQWFRGHEPYAPPDPPQADPDQAWKALGLVNDWIKHSETKAVAVLTAAGATGVAFYNLTKDSLVRDTHHIDWLVTITAILCVAFILASGLCAASTIIPRRKVKGQPEDFVNLLFYSHIANTYGDDSLKYGEVLRTLTSDREELTRHIANQVHANSVVADRKFTWTGRAVKALVAALFALGVLAAIIGWNG